MMSQLAWEVEKKVECWPFPNNLKGREIWYVLEFMFKPKVHVLFCTFLHNNYSVVHSPPCGSNIVTSSQEQHQRI